MNDDHTKSRPVGSFPYFPDEFVNYLRRLEVRKQPVLLKVKSSKLQRLVRFYNQLTKKGGKVQLLFCVSYFYCCLFLL